MKDHGRTRRAKAARRRSNAAPNAARRFHVETLEVRLLLSATAIPATIPADLPVATPAYELNAPLGNTPATTSGPTGYLASQIQHAYGIDTISFNSGTVAGNGAGETIAIVDAYNYPTASSDLHTFDLAMGLPDPPSLVVMSQTGSTTSLPGTDPAGAGSGDDWEVEEALDVEWAHSIAPHASILLVEANSASESDLLTAVNTARQQAGVVAVSMSWSGGEFSGETSDDSYFTTPTAHAGVTFLAATGDSGEPSGYPAYSPNVVAVGGTTLTTTGTAGTYVSEAGWSGSGGGISTYESQPTYQKGVVTQSTTRRTVPDISFDANPNSGVSVYDSYDYGTTDPWLTVGGTSVSTPCWAGLVAIADQGRAVFGQTSLDGATGTLPALYKLSSSDLHDITSGSNGYSAGVGYDLVTGRGTPIANVLVNDLIGINQPPTINPVSNPAAIAENSGAQTINLSGITPGPASQSGETVTITASSSNPSLIGNLAVNYTNPNTTGTLSYTPAINAYGSAVITLTVTNSGGTANGGINTLTETFTVTVTQINLPPTIAPIASPQTVVAGSGPQTINLTGISYGPPGNLGQTVTITATSNNPSLVANPTITYTSPNATGTLTYTPPAAASGSAVITVTVNNNGGTANGGVQTFSETFTLDVYPQNVLATSTVVTYSPPNPIFGQSVTLTATVSSTATPNEGSVTFLYGTTTLGTAPVSNGVATLNVNTLPAGTPAVTATYTDPLFNYANSTSPALNVTITPATPAVVASDSGGVYKGAGYAATATVGGSASLEGVTPALLYYSGSAATGASSSTAPSHVGTYSVVASFAGSADYAAAQSLPVTFTITPAPLIITANNATKVYGAALPAFTASYAGFLGSDTSASLSTLPTLSTSATASSPVSGNPYPITASGAVDPDYTISYVAGSLTVTPAGTSTALAISPAAVSYGQSVTLTATVSGVFTPNEGSVTFSVGGTAFGTAPVVAGVATLVTTAVPAGDDEVIATYSDTGGNYSASNSVVLSTITTVAGTGTSGYSGDNGPATAAGLSSPSGIATDAAGDIFIADQYNDRIREVNHITGTITTVAGNGTGGFSGDNGPATAAQLELPAAVAVDAVGDIFIADEDNQRIREVNHITGIITTVGGNGSGIYSGDNGPATAAGVGRPVSIAVDSSGDIFFSDGLNYRVREINHVTGMITTIAGDGSFGYNGDGGAATAAAIDCSGIGVDAAGDVFIADTINDRIREVNHVTGLIATVAGNGTPGFGGDNGPATAALLSFPNDVFVDLAGDLFIVDQDNNRIREVNHATGLITTVAGSGIWGYGGDNGPATGAALRSPLGVAADYAGDVLIADSSNDRIREVQGNVTVSQVNTSISASALPASITYAQTATLSATVSSATTPNEGTVTFLTGSTTLGSAPVISGVATLNTIWLPVGTDQVTAVYSDAGGEFAASSATAPAVMVSQSTPTVTITDSGGVYKGSAFAATAGVNGSASLEGVSPTFTYYSGTAATGSGSSAAPVHVGTYTVVASFAGSADYTSASSNPSTFSIAPAALTITANSQTKVFGAALPTLTASYAGFQGSDTAASLTTPPTLSTTATATSPVAGSPYPITVGGAVDPDYTISYVAGTLRVTAATTSISLATSAATISYGQSLLLTATVTSVAAPNEGTVTFTAGSTTLGTAPVTAGVATLSVSSLVLGTDKLNASYADASGNLAASATGVIITVAGNGTASFSGDNGPATAAALNDPISVIVDSVGDLYISDSSNNRIREITTSGLIITVAGSAGTALGDNGPATAAELSDPRGIAFDSVGDLFIADSGDSRVREVNHVTGVITTVAGNGTWGYSGDNGLATAAELNQPQGVAVDSAGNIFIADAGDNRIREVNHVTGIITTVAGTGTSGYNGDNIQATAAEINDPDGVTVDTAGDLFIVDQWNDRIREVNHTTGIITTVAGSGNGGYNGNGIQATAAEMSFPQSVALDTAGDLFIADQWNSEVREVNHATGIITAVAGTGSSGYTGDQGPATSAQLNNPFGAAVDSLGDVFIVDTDNNRIREVVASPTVTVTQGLPSVTVSDAGGTYNGTAYAATPAVDGAASLESVSPSLTYYAGSTTTGGPLAGAPTAAGTYTVVASFAGSADYPAATSSPLTFVISPAPLTVTGASTGMTYGGSLPALSGSVSGEIAGDGITATFGTTATAGSHVVAGGYPITGTLIDPNHKLADYVVAYVAGTLTVTPAPLTITANNLFMTAGAPVPPLTASYAGFVNGDSAASLTVPPTLSTTATSASPASATPYPITVGGAVDPDYTFTYVAGGLTVTSLPAPSVTVTDGGGQYDGSAYAASATVNGASTLEGVTPTLVYYPGANSGGAPLNGAPTNVGTYTVVATFAGSADYNPAQSNPLTFSISPAPLTVTANSFSKVYGAALPALTGSITGEAAGDGITATFSTTAAAASPVLSGGYPITAALSDPNGKLSNYTVTVVNGTLTVTPVSLTIAAASLTKSYYAAMPALSANYTGLVNGDTPASLTTGPTLTTTATATSPVGSYSITASGAVDSNYTISYVPGTLTIAAAPAAVSVVASPMSVVYSQSVTLAATVTSTTTVNEGTVTFLAGTTTLGTSSVSASAATLTVASLPVGVDAISAVYSDSVGNFATGSSVTPVPGTLTTAYSAGLNGPGGLAVDSAGDIYIADTNNNRVLEINHATGAVTVVAGNGTGGYTGSGGPATAAELHDPEGLALDSAGNLFIADYYNSAIREVNHTTGVITTVAGNGTLGYSGDGGPATAAELQFPKAVAVDSAGDIFIADWANQRIREVNHATGLITTIAGNGTSGTSGTGGPATAAEVSFPEGVAVDSAGDVFIGDIGQIVEINATTKVINTVGPTNVLIQPTGFVLDPAGDLFIPDSWNDKVYELNHSSGQLSVIAGTGTDGSAGNNGPATAAQLDDPLAVAVDAVGDVYIADSANNRIQEIPVGAAVLVGQVSTSISIAATQTALSYGQSDTFTATVSAVVTPNEGTVTFLSGTTTLGTAPVVAGVATLNLTTLPAGTDRVTASYSDTLANFLGSTTATGVTATVSRATPSVSVTDASGTYNGAAFAATATVAGVVPGVDSAPSASLESVSPTMTYYAGTATSGAALSAAPSTAGTYTVAASFAGSQDYTSAAASAVFIISGAQPAVTVTDSGGVYTGSPYLAATAVNGSASLEGVTPMVMYYSGTTATGTPLGGAPSMAGTYSVLASFAGSQDYTTAAASVVFSITGAQPVVTVTDGGGVYSGSPYPAAALVNGGSSLEGVTPTLSYYSGATTSGAPLSGAPSHAGTYTVVSSFAGSTDYAPDQSAPATYVISPAALTITAYDQTMAYGGPLPTLTASYSGFVGSDTPASLASQPTLVTTANSSSLPSGNPYPITVSGAVDPDYTISYVPGTLTITAVAHTPTVTDATAVQNGQTSSGLVITPDARDAGIVTDFQITGITGGTLYLSDGVTPVADGAFITVAEGAAGLVFAPAANSTATGSFAVQASTTATAAGLGGSIVTATITVTVVPPTSSVQPLGDRTTDTSIPVSWSGTPGSGGPIISYTVSVSTDGGPFTPWLTGTTATSATFTAQTGHIYGFISQATDGAGNVEPAHAAADTTVTVTATPFHNTADPMDVLGTGGPIVPQDALAIIDYLNLHPGDSSLPTTAVAGAEYLDVLGENDVVPADALAIINYLNVHPAQVDAQPAVGAAAEGLAGQSAADQSIAEANPPVPSMASAVVALNAANGGAASAAPPTVSPAVMAVGSLSAATNGGGTASDPANSAAVQAAIAPAKRTVPVDTLQTAAARRVDILFENPSANWWEDAG